MPVKFDHDFETYSEVDLKEVGSSVYAQHHSTEVLMLSYSFDDGPVKQWIPAYGEPIPQEVVDAIFDPNVLFFAHNSSFERMIWLHTLGYEIPINRWRDTMIQGHYCSFPGGLGDIGDILGIPEDKKKSARGKALIRKFCQPRKPTKTKPWTRATYLTDPEDWLEFLGYNIQDTVAQKAIWNRMSPWMMPEHEWAMWHLDQEINDAGIPINLNAVANAERIIESVLADRMARMREITGLANPNSGDQLKPWLQAQGYRYDDLKKGHIQTALDEERKRSVAAGETDATLYELVLVMRSEISKSSVKKYHALGLATDLDGMLRHCLQFGGAPRTLRWSGRRYQPQNLARPWKPLEDPEEIAVAVNLMERLNAEELEMIYGEPMSVLSSCIRPIVQAPKGFTFADADLNAIENRVLGWLAGDEKILDVFANNRDPYIDFATYMYGQSYEELWHEYKVEKKKAKRTVAKPGVLGCGYMLGPGEEHENKQTGEMEATGLLGYAWNMGVRLTKEESVKSVQVWRATFTDAVAYWWAISRAAMECVQTGNPQRAGPVRFDRSGPFLRMKLPSGRHLHYCRPRIEMRKAPWGDMKPTLTYEGINDQGHWGRLTTHPGKLTENADQAISRDLLAHGIWLARRVHGLDVRLHVHDQILALVPEDQGEEALALLQKCMTTPPHWAPDMPLGSAGTTSRLFIKD